MLRDRLDDTLLCSYAETFHGYGSYDAPFWFVGMEEGGGQDIDAVRARLTAWDLRDRRELEDLAGLHRAFGLGRWFDGDHPPIQRTWGALVRLLFSAERRDSSLGTVRLYQGQRLGRSDGETALLELLPLPSPSVGKWNYGTWSSCPQLVDRRTYREHFAPRRARYLRRKREEHRPVAVVYYSLNAEYQRWWDDISGASLEEHEVEGRRLRTGSDGKTAHIVIPHPAARGLRSDFFHAVGRLIAEMRGSGDA
jgi:hypothetical protein